MKKIKDLSTASIELILSHLENNDEFDCRLPGGGSLHIESGLPYLIICRTKNKDTGTKEFVMSEACYLIIGRKDFKGYQELIFSLADHFSTLYKSYLLFELFSTEESSRSFTIKGPATKLPKTLTVLEDGLRQIDQIAPGTRIEIRTVDTPNRHPKGRRPLLTIEKTKQCGALLLGLEVPPVYRTAQGQLFPVFFREFHNVLTKAMQRAIYEFIRIQTVCGVNSYNALGQRYPKEKVFEIDRKLTEIEKSYQFLWLVSPSNIHDIKKTFFESGFETILDYHYRLLPIDPDLLKRELYALKIEKIEDPALSYIFRQKREELDHQITMLHERGTPNFFYNSIRLHQGIGKSLKDEAENLLEQLPETSSDATSENLMDVMEFAALAQKEIDYLKEQDEDFNCKIQIRKDLNIMMVSLGDLFIPADFSAKRKEAEALIQHEVGVHALTYYNGRQQPLEQLSVGLADYDPLQEGLAVLFEYLANGLSTNRLRTLAGRVVAGWARVKGYGFKTIFDQLVDRFGFGRTRAFNITSRIMQGGGFLKDIIYLKGLLELRDYLKNGGQIEPLLSGKFGFHHIDTVQQLTERKILKPPILKPRYLFDAHFETKLDMIRRGLPLHAMVCDNTHTETLIARK
ncbi:flavohemoglobin expression-modulating QEGLA motif protein [Flagellimonas baculiformis]|uniref:flavohemoglobin expression-modulating QEGLA motif protein n=1 Tax=Flagellimonas baculiformis TaxID=3067310 RepID=UPI00296EAE31|nr:tyrosine/phenylalanine carboxypeptidase domain-containing protein [Muricauda sp. D6]